MVERGGAMGNFVRTAAPVAAAAFLGVACAGRSSEVPRAPATVQSALPDAVQIICDGTGTTVLTPVVRPQRDGVHLQVQNTTGEDLSFIVGGDGDSAPAGSSELIWSLPPGTAKIGCVALSAPGDTRPDGDVTVLDAEGIWVDPAVGGRGCPSVAVGSIDYVAGATGEQGDPVELARARLRDSLKEGDVVQAAGYPEEPERHVIVIRDGSTVADLRYVRDEADTGWLVDTEYRCPSFNG
jgi:hypothetical protein